jgi:hypothetical protein
MIGVICPHYGGFAIRLTEKIEDIVGALFLPLYFALSGLSTNLGLLNSGIVWAYVIGIIAVAFFGKFVGASLAARVCGLVWRESFAIGALMSCKGLVELIVLVCWRVYDSQILMVLEHRIASKDPHHANIHHVCGHGLSNNVRDHANDPCSLPGLVSTKARALEARQN